MKIDWTKIKSAEQLIKDRNINDFTLKEYNYTGSLTPITDEQIISHYATILTNITGNDIYINNINMPILDFYEFAEGQLCADIDALYNVDIDSRRYMDRIGEDSYDIAYKFTEDFYERFPEYNVELPEYIKHQQQFEELVCMYQIALKEKEAAENFFAQFPDNIEIYRAIDVDPQFTTYEEIMNNLPEMNVGIFWSWERSGAIAWNSNFDRKGTTIVLHGKVNKDNVDWRLTCYHNLIYYFNEKEISIKPNSFVQIVGIECDKWDPSFYSLNFVVRASHINWAKIADVKDLLKYSAILKKTIPNI